MALCFWFAFKPVQAQTFLNGSFEKHPATEDEINLSNSAYTAMMENSYAFGDCPVTGGPGNMDIITSPEYCGGGAEHGDWYVAFTQGGTDAISLTLSATLVAGNEYTMSFYNKGCYSNPQPFEIGLSATEDEFGTLIFTAPLATEVWTKHTFTFTAPIDGLYITVQLGGPSDCYKYWAMVDHFEMDACTLEVDLGKDTKLCAGETMLLDAATPKASYSWQDGSTDSTFQVTKPGTYWVQVTNDCKTVRDSIIVRYHPVLNVELLDTIVCEGETVILDASNAPNTNYRWQDNSAQPTLTVSNPGVYWVKATDSCGSAADSAEVVHKPLPFINLGADGNLCPGDTIALDVTTENARYSWQNRSNEGVFYVTTPGTYWAEIELDNCYNADSVTFEFGDCEVALQMPNVFTPNGDGINDLFEPMKVVGIEAFTMHIFNRWGQQVHSGQWGHDGWNGKFKGRDCSMATYFWTVEYLDIYGELHTQSGSLTLLK